MIFKRKKDYTLSSMIIDRDTKIIEQWQNLCFESLDKINKAIKYLEENEFEDVYGYDTDRQNLMKILRGEDKE